MPAVAGAVVVVLFAARPALGRATGKGASAENDEIVRVARAHKNTHVRAAAFRRHRRRPADRCWLLPSWVGYRGTRRSSSAGLRHIAEQVVEHVGEELCRVEGAATTAGLVAFRSVRVSSTASTTTATGHPGSARTPVVVLAGAAPESVLGADEVDLLDNGEDNLGREVVDRDSATFDLGAASLGLVVGYDRVGLVARGRARSVGHGRGRA